ncbi:MAG: potassium efflux system protein [Chlamydiales bacterium]|jgi:potassium efflux system protein
MTRIVRRLYTLAVCFTLWVPAAMAQEGESASDSAATEEVQTTAPHAPRVDGPTVEQVRAKLDAIADDTQGDEGARKRLLDLYGNALHRLGRALEWRQRASELLAEQAAAPAAVLDLQGQLDEPALALPRVASETPTSELEQSLAEARRAFDAASRLHSDLEEETQRRAEQKADLPARYAEIQTELRALENELGRAEDSSAEGQAERTRQLARRTELRAESEAVTATLDTLSERQELLDVQGQLAGQRSSRAGEVVAAWSDIVGAQRAREARIASAAAKQAEGKIEQASPRLRALAQVNAKLASKRSEVLAESQSLASQYEATIEQLAQIVAAHESAQARDSLESGRGVRISRGTAALLRRQWSEFPDASSLRRRAELRRRQLSASQLAQADAGAQLDQLGEFDQRVAAELATLEIAAGDADVPGGTGRSRLEEEVRQLLENRVALLKGLSETYGPLSIQLREIKSTDEKLAGEIEAFSAFIEKRLLWSISSPPLWATDFTPAAAALSWLVAPDNWRGALDTLKRDARASWISYSLVSLVVVGLLLGRRRLKRKLEIHAHEADLGACWQMAPTWHAVLITGLLIAPLPLLLRWIGWQLKTDLEVSEFALALGRAMHALGLLVLLVEVPRQVLRPYGLAEKHFGWGANAPIRGRALGWLVLLIIPTAGSAAMIRAQTISEWQPSIQRSGLILALLGLALCTHLALRPIHDPEKPEESQRSWAWRAARAVGIAMPSALAGLATLGYSVTAVQLASPFVQSIVVLFIAVTAHALVHRWLLVTRRAATFERERREQAEDPESEGSGPPRAHIDLDLADLQTRRMFDRLLLIGCAVWLWLLWVDIVALGGVQDIELWRTGTFDNQSIATLNDLLVALLGLAVTFIGARNLPGVLDLLLLRKLPIRPGDRLVIATVSRYLMIMVGLSACMRRVGLGWGQLQWMAAAVSVGLGFGLQEIFANFISGVIILFERPIRIGDLVTVGKIDGRVTNIALRATTITDYDRRELLVPNKEFITRQLVNWTLSDTVTRVVFPVSVSRSCDPTQASQVLTGIARHSPLVMSEPKPDVVFRGFSEDALEFDLRVFIAERISWTELMNSLNLAIHTEFAKAGLEIATRHQDLHVKSIEGLPQVFANRADVTIEKLGPE